MLRGYRCIIAAFAGLVLVGTSEPPKPAAQIEQAQAREAPRKSQAQTSNPTGEAAKRVDSSKEGEPCGQRRYQSNEDLCAQWKAADAARDAADWAYLQIILSAAGVLGLGMTLWFNFRGLNLAEKQATETKDALAIARQSADAATKLANTADASARKDLRAYLDTAKIRYTRCPDFDGGPHEVGLRLKVTLQNYGKTPAENVEILTVKTIRMTKLQVLTNSEGENKSRPAIIAPNDKFISRIFFRINRDLFEMVASGQAYLGLKFICTYTDVFGDNHVLRGDYECREFGKALAVLADTRVST